MAFRSQPRRFAAACSAAVIASAIFTVACPIEIPAPAQANLLGAVAARAGLFGLIVVEVALALGIGGVLCGASYLYFFVARKQRFNPGYRPDVAANRRARMWAALSLWAGVLFAAPLQFALLCGLGRAYYRIGDYSLGYLALSVLLLVAFTETAVYWIHRALHHRVLFRWLHVHHHRYREPTPWAAFAFHPLDAFAQALPYHVAAFLFPLHFGVYSAAVALVMLWSISIHDRVTLVPFRWLLYAGHHTIHHLQSDRNYGQFFTFWDRVAGTHRCPSTLPDTFAAGRPHGLRR